MRTASRAYRLPAERRSAAEGLPSLAGAPILSLQSLKRRTTKLTQAGKRPVPRDSFDGLDKRGLSIYYDQRSGSHLKFPGFAFQFRPAQGEDMDIRTFVNCHRSTAAEDVHAARKEFEERRELSKKLADRLRDSVTTGIAERKEILRREDHFYSVTPEGERFLAFVTPVSRKKQERLANKLHERLTKNPSLATENWWWHAMDLARFRIVTANLADLLAMRNLLARIVKESGKSVQLKLRDEVRDFIWSRPNEQYNASKSLHFLVHGPEHEIVEVQIMTLLQYSWDQIQHWLYERQRARGAHATQLDENVERSYWALSNTFFILDEYIVWLDGDNPLELPNTMSRAHQ